MARTFETTVEIDIDEAIDACISEKGIDYIIKHIGKDEILGELTMDDFISHFGEAEVARALDSSTIDEEYLKRCSPLAKTMEENND